MKFLVNVHYHLRYSFWKYICKTYHSNDNFLYFIITSEILCIMQRVCCNGLSKKKIHIPFILNILRIYCYWRFRVFTRDSFSVNTLCTTIRAATNWHLGIWLSLPNCIIGIWGNSITSKLEEEWGKWLSIEIPLHHHIAYHITDMDFD